MAFFISLKYFLIYCINSKPVKFKAIQHKGIRQLIFAALPFTIAGAL